MSWTAPANTAVVRITTNSGAVHVTAEGDRTECWSNVDALDGSPLTIDGGSSNVEVRVPDGTDLVIGSTSGTVTVDGRVGALSVLTTSGRISIDHAASVDARSTSGRVEVGHADGSCRVVSTSGRVEIGRCGAADATSGSGRIVLADVHGSVRANCTSGKIVVGVAGAHDVRAETVSGRIEVSYPAEVRPLVTSSVADLAATTSSHDCTVVARSGSGRVVVSAR
ncbi:MAG TPA: DUF4097 family beta strand repeat-containing protein [Ilumatobacteraceae bacterium]|nr:DUF4097 family beta strand repeat-containing protein [Ilumatobacteraceae bacterium]